MTNVVHFPDCHPQFTGEAVLREQIRMHLGAVVGAYHRNPSIADATQCFQQIITAIQLMRAYHNLTEMPDEPV